MYFTQSIVKWALSKPKNLKYLLKQPDNGHFNNLMQYFYRFPVNNECKYNFLETIWKNIIK